MHHVMTLHHLLLIVCLTSDIWSGNDKEDYLSVVAHYINFDWQLEKRMLDLVLIDVSHNV